jgi:hypothetical protein
MIRGRGQRRLERRLPHSRIGRSCGNPPALRIVVVVAALLASTACDKLMIFDVSVSTSAGAPLEDAHVEVTIAGKGRVRWERDTPARGAVTGADIYGFRSAPRVLTVSKASYKTFQTTLVPRRRYVCRVFLRLETERESSVGQCAGR